MSLKYEQAEQHLQWIILSINNSNIFWIRRDPPPSDKQNKKNLPPLYAPILCGVIIELLL